MKHHIFRKILLACYLPAAANFPLLFAVCRQNPSAFGGFGRHLYLLFLLLACCCCVFAWLNLVPYPRRPYAGTRITVMMGGRTLCYCALYIFAFQAVLCFFAFAYNGDEANRFFPADIGISVYVWNVVFSLIFAFLLLWNGILRIFLPPYACGLASGC